MTTLYAVVIVGAIVGIVGQILRPQKPTPTRDPRCFADAVREQRMRELSAQQACWLSFNDGDEPKVIR